MPHRLYSAFAAAPRVIFPLATAKSLCRNLAASADALTLTALRSSMVSSNAAKLFDRASLSSNLNPALSARANSTASKRA